MLLSTLAVAIGVLLAGVVIMFYTVAKLRKRKQQNGGDATGTIHEADGHSNTTVTPSHVGWSEHTELNAMSPGAGSGNRIASGNASPASGAAGNNAGFLPGGFGSVSGKMGAAGSFGSVMGATAKLGDDSDSPRSDSQQNDGVSQASLGKSGLTLKDGMGGRKPSGNFAAGAQLFAPQF